MSERRREAQAHVTLADGRAFTLSAAVIRVAADDGGPPARLVWAALTDVARGRCLTAAIGDHRLPGVLRARLARDPAARPATSRRALDEVLATGRLPYPDVTVDAAARDAADGELAGTGLTALDDGGHRLRLHLPDHHVAGELLLRPRTASIAGGAPALAAWCPRCDVTGTLTLDGVTHAIADGAATWFAADGDAAPARLTVQLADATMIHVWQPGADAPHAQAIVVGADGATRGPLDATLAPRAAWTSLATFHEHATAWALRVPAADVALTLRAAVVDQEVVTATTSPPRWRGRCDATGTIAGRTVAGLAFVDHAAPGAATTLPEVFAAVPDATLGVIRRQFPLPLDAAAVRAMLGGTAVDRYLRDVDAADLERLVIAPIRAILDRKGKAWRSYTAVVCFYALRGDRARQDVVDVLLGLAEVIHVGSLIVDDIEDASPSRRGGPACHVAHGVPIAINAGTFCYFAWQAWFARLDVPDAAKLQIYELYFGFMRLAHLGQALDLQGFPRALTEAAVATGDVAPLARQLEHVYLLKTGAPASVFAQIGAIVAGGNAAQVAALGELFEALGIAFQIMDDVQNLKGFHGDAKHGEDLAQAKVTMPVLEALRRLDAPARGDLWARIARCGEDPGLVPGLIATLDGCGAFAACRDQAHARLERAWQQAAAVLEDSIAKIMLRSFCLYVVECLG